MRSSSAENVKPSGAIGSTASKATAEPRYLALHNDRTIVRRLVVAPFALAISAYLTASVHQMPNCLPVAWLGLIPVFWLIRTMKPLGALFAGAFWGLCLAFIWHSYVRIVPCEFNISTFAIIAAPAAYAALAARYTRKFGFSPFALALGWIGLELSLSACLPRGEILMSRFEGNPFLSYIANVLGCGFVAFIVSFLGAMLMKVGKALCEIFSVRQPRLSTSALTCHFIPESHVHHLSLIPQPSVPRAPPISDFELDLTRRLVHQALKPKIEESSMSKIYRPQTISVILLCLSCALAAQAAPLQHNGVHHGTINGSPFKATVNGAMEMTTGVVSGNVTIDSIPPIWHPGHAAWSLFCISCANGAREIGGAKNFYDILGGSGTYTHTRTYTFPNYPAETLKVSASFSLAANTLTYTGNWSGNTNLVPTDLDSVAQYTQTLLTVGDGLIDVSGDGKLYRTGGSFIPVHWQGQYNLGPGHNPPMAKQDATVHIGFATTDNVHYTLSGSAFLEPGSVPTLSEWGLIIFSLLILSLVTVAVLRRKTAVAGAGSNMQVTVGGPLFVSAIYFKTLLVTVSLAAVGLAISAGVYGTLALRDIIGTFLSAAIVAYMAHVVIIRRKED